MTSFHLSIALLPAGATVLPSFVGDGMRMGWTDGSGIVVSR